MRRGPARCWPPPAPWATPWPIGWSATRTARWLFVEYRQEPPLLPPGTAWMQGAAGIAAFLFRLARVMDDGREAPVVDRPDEWWAVPARLRTVQG